MKRWPGLLFATVVLAALYAPMAAVAVLSFRTSKLGLTGSGHTLKWYGELWRDSEVRDATGNSLKVAVFSTVISAGLGTALALGRAAMERRRKAAGLHGHGGGRLRHVGGAAVRGAAGLSVALPVVVPDVVMAAALIVAFRALSMLTGWGVWNLGLPTVVMGHVTLQVAFVALVVAARLERLPTDIDEAAGDLYASGWFQLTRVTLPLLLPAIVAGALLAFVLSIDDFVIAFFTAGVKSGTLPMYIYGSVKRGISPELHALSTVMTGATLLAIGAA